MSSTRNAASCATGGAAVSLQPLTFDTLALLVRNHDRVVQKQELLDALWPDGFVAEGSLQRAISLVRSAIGDDKHEVIRTFSGRGYRFCAAVEPVDGAVPHDAASVLNEAVPSPDVAAKVARRTTEPRIQYARASDGVNIAYWTLGEGKPLVFMADAPSSHIRMEWDIPELRAWYEAIAQERMLIRFDPRGGGMSDRSAHEFSLEAHRRDIEAIAESLRLNTFDLFAYVDAGPVVIDYAALNPERVSHLILWCAYAKREEYNELPQITAVRALMDLDYALYMKTLAHLCLGWAAGEPVRRWAQLMTDGWSRETLARIYAAIATYDVRDDLPRVTMPALVMHPRGLDWFPEDASIGIAAGIRDAKLALVDCASALPWVGDWQPTLEIIEEFLNER